MRQSSLQVFCGSPPRFCEYRYNVAGNSIQFGNDFMALFPRHMNIRRGQYLCALIGFVICPWKIEKSATTFLAFPTTTKSSQGPLLASSFAITMWSGRQTGMNSLSCMNFKGSIGTPMGPIRERWLLSQSACFPNFQVRSTISTLAFVLTWLRQFFILGMCGCICVFQVICILLTVASRLPGIQHDLLRALPSLYIQDTLRRRG